MRDAITTRCWPVAVLVKDRRWRATGGSGPTAQSRRKQQKLSGPDCPTKRACVGHGRTGPEKFCCAISMTLSCTPVGGICCPSAARTTIMRVLRNAWPAARVRLPIGVVSTVPNLGYLFILEKDRFGSVLIACRKLAFIRCRRDTHLWISNAIYYIITEILKFLSSIITYFCSIDLFCQFFIFRAEFSVSCSFWMHDHSY